jgi:hypothetical protein
MTSFSKHLSYAAFERMAQFDAEWRAGPKTDWQSYQATEEACLGEPLKAFLADRRNAGILRAVALAGHRNWDVDGWNRFIETGDQAELSSSLMHSCTFELLYWALNPPASLQQKLGSLPEDARMRAAYADLVERADAGSFLRGPDIRCDVCGARLRAGFKDWNITLTTSRYQEPDHLAPCAYTPGLKEVTLQVTSGELLIADWFRIEGFTDIVDAEKLDFEINFAAGKVEQTQYYADAYGFVSVSVGNSMPAVYVNTAKDRVVVGRMREDIDEEDYQSADSWGDFSTEGRVCTDLWWTTAIDRQRLIDILASRHGPAKAAELVEEYLDENRIDVTRIPLPNGRYRVQFNSRKDLAAQLSQEIGRTAHKHDAPDMHIVRIPD